MPPDVLMRWHSIVARALCGMTSWIVDLLIGAWDSACSCGFTHPLVLAVQASFRAEAGRSSEEDRGQLHTHVTGNEPLPIKPSTPYDISTQSVPYQGQESVQCIPAHSGSVQSCCNCMVSFKSLVLLPTRSAPQMTRPWATAPPRLGARMKSERYNSINASWRSWRPECVDV
jgi:hypothetical protein